jgi:hypothetical protein
MIPLISAGFVVVILGWSVLLLWRFPAEVSLFVLAAVVVLKALGIELVELNLGVTVYQDDLACLAMIAGAAIVAARNRTLPLHLCRPALILLELAGVNFLRGALLFGPRPAGNGVRVLVFFIVPFLALSVVGPALKVTFSRAAAWLCGAACLFTGVSLGRWTGILPVPESLLIDFRQIPRVMGAEYPMIIGQALIVIVGLQLSRGVRLFGMLSALLLGAVVLVSQHRSVWIATAVGLVWLTFRSLRYVPAGRIVQFTVATTAVVTIASLYIIASGRTAQVTSMFKVNIEEAEQEDSSLAWRVSGFGEAIDRTFSAGPVQIVFGPPAGRDLTDIASVAARNIHNRYVDTLAYYGLSGLLLLLRWFGLLAARVGRMKSSILDRDTRGMPGLILQAILLAEFIYFMAYSGNLLHGAVLGLLWVTSAHVTAPQALRSASRDAGSVVSDPVLIEA